jgi:hypothetical protein
MAEKQVYLQITGPFGLDRRDSAIVKPNPGILYELENFLIHNGNLEVREGLNRAYSYIYATPAPIISTISGGYRILSLFRYYGLTALEQELKELYAAVNGSAYSYLKKWTGTYWSDLYLPPGINLTKQDTTPATMLSRPPSLGNFEQFKDRVYYTNHTEPVLMIKKEDTQVYEAGIPEANAELLIDDCESDTGWAGYTNADHNNFYLDGGFDRHTEGDYGITMEELKSGETFKLVKTLTDRVDLEWFYKVKSDGSITTPDAAGTRIVDSAATFTKAYLGSWVKNTSDGSTAIITEVVDTHNAITTKLSGGTNNDYGASDKYIIGSYSSEYDYIAIDIFRFVKTDISEVLLDLSSGPPNASGDFAYGHRLVIYADTGFEHFDLHQRTMLATWAINPYSNTLFFGRFRKRWFIPLHSTATTGTTGTTLKDNLANFPDILVGLPGSIIGKAIINRTTGRTGTVTARVSATELTVTGTSLTFSVGNEYQITDTWDTIKYIKVSMQNDANSSGNKEARITIDNIRLLKTPPLPSELKIQVATCDAIEMWTISTDNFPTVFGALVTDDFTRATEGASCKKIPHGFWVQYNWGYSRDLSKYGEGTVWDGSDTLVFDIAGQAGGLLSSLIATIRFYDAAGNIAQADFNNLEDWGNPQQRHLHMQEFYYLVPSATSPYYADGTTFDWTSVTRMAFKNIGIGGNFFYIDNIRIQPPSASKMLNKFMPLDLIVMDAVSRGIEAKFGENSFVDTVADWLFNAYAEFTRQVVGQGRVVFPDYLHGRYKIAGDATLASLQMQVDAGGSLSINFIQNNDLSEYKDFNFNLDRLWAPRKKNPDSTEQWWGVDWVEIPASDSDEFSIWMSTPDASTISHIIFRFYVNKDADWGVQASPFVHAGGGGIPSTDSKILQCPGHHFAAKTSLGLIAILGRRIRRHRTGVDDVTGIVNWVYGNEKLLTWGITWNDGDEFTIDQYNNEFSGDDAVDNENYGFKFRQYSKALSGNIGRPQPDKDNYYEYVFDVHQMVGKVFRGFTKSINKAIKHHSENEENLESLREMLTDYGIQLVYKEKDEGSGEGWWKAIITFKRGDCVPHFKDDCPWGSWQCIAAHEIIVRASSKKDCVVNFQDFMITKKGAVSGTQLQYKMKLEDELGYLGPASDSSYPVTVKGQDVNLADIYIPYDTRIVRKRIYRTDSTGTFRYLDTIGRLETTYLDQIPEELLGSAIEEDVYRPPKCAHIRKIDNRMAYIDCYDRRRTRRPSRIHISLPFIPHQCRDGDCFDIMPEDGQKAVWCEWYYGHLIVWKERSMYVIDPNTFEKSPRDLSIGCIAPLSVAAIPDGGFAWLSHAGVIFGDHTKINKEIGEQIWPDLQNYTPQQLSHAVGWYHDRYYYIFLGYDSGVYNTRGYACYLPNGTWSYISGWNIQCVSIWNGGTDNGEILTGSNYGYVNKLFTGEVDRADNAGAAESQITSALRTLDYDLNLPQSDKYLNWVIFHAKNLSSDPTRKGLLTITPYYDQQPTKALDDEQVMHTYYKKYDLCQDPGYEQGTTLIGFRLTGIKRYAIKGMTLDITEQGFRASQEAGQY